MAPRCKTIFTARNAALLVLGISVFVLAHLIFNMHFSPVRLRYSQPPTQPMAYTQSDIAISSGIIPLPVDTRPVLDDPYNPPLVFPETETQTQVLTTSPELLPHKVMLKTAHPSRAEGRDLSKTIPIPPMVGRLSNPTIMPINVRTRGIPTEYRQLGLLTRNSGQNKIMLPLMGRNLQNGRDKWQYYTMSNSPGTMQTRLPVSVNGRSCSSEYGCDSISNGDTVYVEGYEETFRATLYDTGLFAYIPVSGTLA